MEERLVICGKFTHIRYRNDLNGFTVASFKLNDHQEKTITVTGILPEVDLHALYECKGNYSEDVRYGLQFVIEEIHYQRPSDEETLVQYFSSSRFSGIGKITAQKIVDAFGMNAIEMIQNDPSILNSIFKKNDDKRIQSIIDGIRKNDELDESVLFFKRS